MKSDSTFTVIIDSREQKPYRFADSQTRALKSGDYSIAGLENRIAVERKSKQDAYASLGAGRSRFEREVQRLARFEYSAIVIEADLADFLEPPAYTQMNPRAAVNSLISWSVKYGIHVFFCHGRKHAKALTYRILEKFWKHRRDADAEQQ